MSRPALLATAHDAMSARRNWLVAGLGGGLLLASTAPLYRILLARETGLAGAATVELADAYRELQLAALALLGMAALLGALLIPDARTVRAAQAAEHVLLRPRTAGFAAGAALLAALLTAAFTSFVLGGLPNHIDSLAQLLHARVWASGLLAARAEPGEFWMIQNSLLTTHGWLSQYPPGHVLLLALGIKLGAPALVGAVQVAVLVFASALLAERLLPRQRTGVRVGILLLATSPFVIALGGSYMNHITAATLLVCAGYALVRVRDGGRVHWALLAGVLLAWAFATRPLAAVAAGGALLLLTLDPRTLLRPAFAVPFAAGATPLLAALLAYNAHFFGAPLRFGYDVALGPSAGLGWQRDPWGNIYGAQEALAYTSADLVSLNTALLESPLPALTLVALYLLTAKRIERGVRVLLGWALLPLAANLLYWHHGQFMGPRMLYETAPAWLLLTGIAAVALARALPARLPRLKNLSPRSAYGSALAAATLCALLFLAPSRALSYAGDAHAVMRTPLPAVTAPALVFVHDAWRSRVAMRLAASGMRLDSVEVAVRANSTCAAQQLADAIEAGDVARRYELMRTMDFRARGRDLPPLSELSPGNRVVLDAGVPLAGECLRQAYSDRHGVLDLAPLAWRGAVPGSDATAPRFVRDLGPALNRKLLAATPTRAAYVYFASGPQQTPTLLPYEQGMALLWGATP